MSTLEANIEALTATTIQTTGWPVDLDAAQQQGIILVQVAAALVALGASLKWLVTQMQSPLLGSLRRAASLYLIAQHMRPRQSMTMRGSYHPDPHKRPRMLMPLARRR